MERRNGPQEGSNLRDRWAWAVASGVEGAAMHQDVQDVKEEAHPKFPGVFGVGSACKELAGRGFPKPTSHVSWRQILIL